MTYEEKVREIALAIYAVNPMTRHVDDGAGEGSWEIVPFEEVGGGALREIETEARAALACIVRPASDPVRFDRHSTAIVMWGGVVGWMLALEGFIKAAKVRYWADLPDAPEPENAK